MRRHLLILAVIAGLAGCGRSGPPEKTALRYLDSSGASVAVEEMSGGGQIRVTLPDGSTQVLQRTTTSSGTRYRKGSLSITIRGEDLTVFQNNTPVFSGRRSRLSK